MNAYYNDRFVTLYCGDCREVLRSINSVPGIRLITDPPYGINLQPQRCKTDPIKNDSNRDAKALLHSILPELDRILPPNSIHLVFAGWSCWWLPEMLSEWFTIQGAIVWDKLMFGIGYYTRPQFELIWNLHRDNPRRPERPESNIWQEMREQTPEHSCEKPVKLMQRAVQFTEARTVLDPFAGIGSSLVAAKALNRQAIGIELEERYCEIAANRLLQEVFVFDPVSEPATNGELSPVEIFEPCELLKCSRSLKRSRKSVFAL